MAGLLDFLGTPAGMGLLSAAAGTMAGARRGQPWNTAGRGALDGLYGYASAKDQVRADQENAFQRQYREMQMDQMRRQREQQKAMREAGQAAAAKAMPMENVYVPTGNQSPLMPNLGGGSDAVGDYSMMGGASPVSFTNEVQQRQGQFDPNAYSSAMMAELAQRGFADEALKYAPKQREPLKVSAGDRLIDPSSGQEVYAAPDAGPKFSQDMMDFLNANGIDPATADRSQLSDAYNAVQSIKNERARLSAQTVTLGSPQMFTTEDGQTVMVQPANRPGAAPQVTPLPNLKPSTADKPPTEAEASSAGYLSRMRAAESLLPGLSGGESTELTSAAAAVPFVGSYAQRKVMTPVQQQYKQAADDWIRAKLRKESGAVIGADEMAAEYITYFPQPGDTPQVIKQKAAARKQAEKQFEISAGRALDKVGNSYQANPQPSAMPRFGEVRNGYRFIGGANANPKDPKNWQRVR